MRRLAAAVLVTAAAAAIAIVGVAASSAGDAAVRAEVTVAGEGQPLDVGRMQIVGGLHPGRSYRLPAVGVRNQMAVRTAYRLVLPQGAVQAEMRPPRHWLRFVPPTVVVDAGRSRAVGVRLELPRDAEPGEYGVVLSVRPGGSDGARLTFRIEPADGARSWLGRAAAIAIWLVPALVGVVLSVLLARAGA